MPVALALIDDRVQWANAAMQTLLKYTERSALIGLPLNALVLPGGSATEERWLQADGAGINVEVDRMAVEGGTLVIVREAIRADRFTAELLADRLEPTGALAAGLAHQINNPLAYLLANLYYIEETIPDLIEDVRKGRISDQKLAEELKELDSSIADSKHGAERVATIVRDLKLLSNVDDDSMEDLDPRKLVESAFNVVQSHVQERARIVKDYQDVPRVLGNESRLAQVFVDILLNAAESIPEGKHSDIHISTSTDPDGWAVIAIADRGIGIPPEILPRIFDPFFTTKPIGEGTGLGLTVCHAIVTSLGGRIHVESTPGKGTTFRVVLPPTDFTRRIANATIPSPPPSLRRFRMLVVDDELHLIQALRRQLGAQHDVIATTSPMEALDILLAGETFDIVLCDVVMPELNGIEIYERVKAKYPEQAKSFVFMTGGAFTQKMRKFLDGIENQRLDKPFSYARLYEVLEAIHPRNKSHLH